MGSGVRCGGGAGSGLRGGRGLLCPRNGERPGGRKPIRQFGAGPKVADRWWGGGSGEAWRPPRGFLPPNLEAAHWPPGSGDRAAGGGAVEGCPGTDQALKENPEFRQWLVADGQGEGRSAFPGEWGAREPGEPPFPPGRLTEDGSARHSVRLRCAGCSCRTRGGASCRPSGNLSDTAPTSAAACALAPSA